MCSVFGLWEDLEDYDTLVGKDLVPQLTVTDLDRTLLTDWEKDASMTLKPVIDVETLWSAAETGDVARVRECIEAGVDVDAQDETDRYSALLAAAEAGHIEVVATLQAARADVDARDIFGRSPVYAASVAGHVDVVKLLSRSGADLESPDEDSRTPFWAACATRQIETARVLVEVGVKLDHRDKSGQTPFDFASLSGHADVLSFLTRDCGYEPQRDRRLYASAAL